MNKQKIKAFIYRYIIPYGGLVVVKLISATYRLRVIDPEHESDLFKQGISLIYTSWHQRFFPGIAFFATRKPITIMISQSRDGEYIARIATILGWRPVRGSSTRGGLEALQELKKLSSQGYRVAHIVDGPTGPPEVVKSGLLAIARHAGIPVVPTITSGQHKWIFNSWDRFMIPKPFSRVIIRFGEPVFVPPDLAADAFEKKRAYIEKTLQDLYADTDHIWDDPGRIAKIFGRD